MFSERRDNEGMIFATKLFGRSWTVAEAIFELFIADGFDASIDSEKRQAVKGWIANQFRHTPEPGPGSFDDDIQKAALAFKSIRKVVPGITAKNKLHALIWIRWAIQSQSPQLRLSNHFFERYAEWRARLAKEGLALMVYRTSSAERFKGRRIRMDGVGEQIGYLLDEIILGKELKTDPYCAEWKMKFLPYAEHAGIESDNQEIADHDTPAATIQNEEILSNPNVITALSKAIEQVIHSKQINVLSANKINGVYHCSVFRQDLIQLLKKHTSLLDRYSEQTLIRALPSIVKCPRGRRGGL